MRLAIVAALLIAGSAFAAEIPQAEVKWPISES